MTGWGAVFNKKAAGAEEDTMMEPQDTPQPQDMMTGTTVETDEVEEVKTAYAAPQKANMKGKRQAAAASKAAASND